MYLKSIEVQGFKSFFHKMKFEFNGGITAIVGPNGSGKSNIGDAVRWVLGEQSAKQLRGSKMEDVIFSGTELRKPVGFAYVALTLDNSDHKIPIEYDEVVVARRVYRSGESEYLINGSNCRLKDVQELFFDTGIGKEGYSIIGQGQVDKILSSKPEDRRELFDEAAGISKFKKRKSQAEKNLETEQLNLSRINDILTELERQVGPLKRQSETARQYLQYRDELKSLDVNMFLWQYDGAEKNKKELEEKLQTAEADLEGAKKDYAAIKEEYADVEQQVEALDEKLDGKRSELEETKIRLEQLDGQIQVMQEQIAGARQSEGHLNDRIDSLRKERQSRLEQAQEAEQAIASLERDCREARAKADREAEELSALQEKIETFTKLKDEGYDKVLEMMGGDSDAKAELEKNYTLLEQNNIRRQELLEGLNGRKEQLDSLEEAEKRGRAELTTVRSRMARYEASNENAAEELEEIERELAEKGPVLRSRTEEQQRQTLRLESVRNIAERYDGYGNSIRQVMNRKGTVPGIIGVVADIITVDRQYEAAIEVALGGSIQNIVTETEQTAKQLVEYLKKNRYGRATFLPLDSVKGSGGFGKREALKEPGAIGVASSLVKAEARFSGLLDYLLGRILVVDQMDHALAIARKYRFSLRIVTLEGEVLTPGGAITGGAYKNSGSLLGRSREIDDLKKTLAALKKETAELGSRVEELKRERQEKQEILEENKTALQELKVSLSVCQTKYDQCLEAVEHQKHAMESARQEYGLLEENHGRLKEEIRKLEEDKSNRDRRNQTENEKIEAYNQELGSLKKQQSEKSRQVSALRMDAVQKDQKLRYTRDTIERLTEEAEHFQEEETMLVHTLSDNASLVEEKQGLLKELYETVEAGKAAASGLQEEVARYTREKAEITVKQKSFFEKREAISGLMNELDKEVYRLTNQQEKLTAGLQSLMDYMWEEYELTYNRALLLKTESQLSQPQMKKAIGELKFKIKELGPVNVNAIEEYKELSERYELMSTQRDDLVEAEEALRRIIAELDEEMRKLFREKFEAINEQFNIVFKELFGGGHGRLELMEEEDILEAGIRIIAQPPGKKLQNMMMLSGGEKALTAISLLFAILNLKPSPFCLLDEIEAALDDNNVKRFAKYLQKLCDGTQFIVITHRRGTMTAADVLYGITMQEKGVSTMVSVNMIDDQLEK